jgi:hypothetical protein
MQLEEPPSRAKAPTPACTNGESGAAVLTPSLQPAAKDEQYFYAPLCSVSLSHFIGGLRHAGGAVLKSAESLSIRSREGQVAYAVPSSFPYSWLNNGDCLNYTQWKRGATWAMADYYSSSCDADVRAKHPESPAPTKSHTDEKCAHEKA